MTLPNFSISPVAAAGRRQAPRVRLALPGRVMLVTGPEPCRLEDLSQTGACVCLGRHAPAVGDDAVLEVDGVEAFGTVVWRRGSQFGMLFETALGRDEVVRLRNLHDHYEEQEAERRRRRARDFVQGRRVF